jgi:hypothetical protein
VRAGRLPVTLHFTFGIPTVGRGVHRSPDVHPVRSSAAGDEREGSYANSREEQSKFEGLVREEGDWQDAVEDVVEGEEPDEEQPPAAAGPS